MVRCSHVQATRDRLSKSVLDFFLAAVKLKQSGISRSLYHFNLEGSKQSVSDRAAHTADDRTMKRPNDPAGACSPPDTPDPLPAPSGMDNLLDSAEISFGSRGIAPNVTQNETAVVNIC